ncbi:hypothetical protein ACRE_004840 [Hapsidospora chrysogenum ATCC 11550]|uniref:Uncharacterized protein n=1 Tax=Hapsidospora chrysogenum (strain ATCC 11550 / CBS 779.69 / DSM 880 / IAM 14645 / JCM 23072 / IMI 49137) TaxID=857340 RepID=A0A086TGZ5_HAPC1|nr:hypothetical protein ACRE_004840 [Hapsidospora chrysogenum ATCC 11550]
MASDEDYMAFLNKANEDVSGGSGQAAAQSSKVQSKAVDSGAEVPKEIREVCRDAFYVSDTDEQFEGVSLRWNGEDGLPDEVEFAKLINHPQPSNAEVEIMDPTDWDRKGQYNKLLEAVRQASQGNDVRVYRVTWDRTRVEYWLITRADGQIVGAKALAVES